MKSLIFISLLTSFTCSIVSASPFDQVQQVQTQNERTKADAEAERVKNAQSERRREQANEIAVRQQRAAADQNAKRQAMDAANARNAEAMRQQSRAETFEDEDRALALEEKKLELEAKKAKVARSNDYIDAELREHAAKTDVVQSEADATRNISSGAKSSMESSGKADINRSNSWFKE